MSRLAPTSTLFRSIVALTLVSIFIVGSATPSLTTHAAAAKPRDIEANHPRANGLRKHNGNRENVANTMANLPITFEANQGHFDKRVKFFARGNGYALSLTQTESVITLSKSRGDNRKTVARGEQLDRRREIENASVSMKLAGANSNPVIEGTDRQPGKVNYFTGNDRKKWRTGVSSYAKVNYHEVYPGIDLVYYGKGQQLEYDFVVAPGADPKKIRMHFKGTKKLAVSPSGDLVLETSLGAIHHRKPFIYQEVNGIRKAIAGRFLPLGKNQVGFEIGTYELSKQLVIDPAIVYSTFLGGPIGAGSARGIAVYTDTATGKTYAYVTGNANSDGFPTRNAFQTTGSGFVAKLDMSASGDASLIYSTFIGYVNTEGIAVDSGGNAYVTGKVDGNNLPVVNAFQTTNQGSTDAFILKLNAGGNGILYSSYLGGSNGDAANGIAIDSAGNAYVTGATASANFPTINGYQTMNRNPQLPHPGRTNAFVSKIAPPSGGSPATLVYSTYLGGSGRFDYGSSVAVDPAGNAYVTGTTTSPDFPVANAYQSNLRCHSNNGGNAFVAKLDPSVSGAASLKYSTYLGGTCHLLSPGDEGSDIAVDSGGNAYVTGETATEDFPTTSGAYQTSANGGRDAFVTKLSASGSGLVYSTYLGSDSWDHAYGIAVDSGGNAYVTGFAWSSYLFPFIDYLNNPSVGIFQSINNGQNWADLNNGLTDPIVSALVIDTSTTPRTLYAGTASGIFKSTNGGVNWSIISTGIANALSLAMSPTNPSTVYAGTDSGIYKSNDHGASWNFAGLAGQIINSLIFDSVAGSQVIYAATDSGLYKTSDGGNTWQLTGLDSKVLYLTIDPNTSPHTLYASSTENKGRRSVDGGVTWEELFISYTTFTSIAVDPRTTPSTLYATDLGAGSNDLVPFWKSTDGGTTWQPLASPPIMSQGGGRLALDPTSAGPTLYATALEGLIISTDGGSSWTAAVQGGTVGGFAVDVASTTATTPATVYVCYSGRAVDSFVTKLNASGSEVLVSTFLGGFGDDYTRDIAVDSTGNIYVTGFTQSNNLPMANAYQPALPSSESAFVMKLGSAALPSISTETVTTQVAVQTGVLEMSFPNITGSTTSATPTVAVSTVDTTTAANLLLSNNLGAYEITTTATYDTSGYASDPTEGIKLAFTVPVVNDESVFNGLVITHGEDQNSDGIIQANEMIPYNGTVDPNKITHHDFATRTVWVYVPTLSPFVIVKGAPDQFNDLIKMVKGFNLKAGIQNSLDTKLQKALKGYQAALAKDRPTACNEMNSFISESQAQSGKALTPSQTNQLIIAARQIKVVLGCQ